jgi:hypothetical protein
VPVCSYSNVSDSLTGSIVAKKVPQHSDGIIRTYPVDENGHMTKEYRLKMRDFTRKAFPDGKVPLIYHP